MGMDWLPFSIIFYQYKSGLKLYFNFFWLLDFIINTCRFTSEIPLQIYSHFRTYLFYHTYSLLKLLNLWIDVFHQFRKFLDIINFIIARFSLYSPFWDSNYTWTPMIYYVDHLTVFGRYWILCSTLFVLLLSFSLETFY